MRRVLVVTAHPDDVDFGAAGTVAAFTAAGVEVTYCIVTNGDAGRLGPHHVPPEMAALRQDEQRAAAAMVGVSDVRFLGHPDGWSRPRRVAARHQPRHPPGPARAGGDAVARAQLEFIFASHPDHLATGEAAVDAVYPDARNPFAHPELLDVERLEPWTVPSSGSWVPAVSRPSVAVDTTATVERKVAALMCHKSQMSDPDAVAQRVHDWARGNAELAGLPRGTFRRALPGHPHSLSDMGTGDPWLLVQHVAFEGPGASPERSPTPAPT